MSDDRIDIDAKSSPLGTMRREDRKKKQTNKRRTWTPTITRMKKVGPPIGSRIFFPPASRMIFFFIVLRFLFFFIGGLEGTSSSSLGVTSVLTLRVKFAFEIGSGWARSIELEDELKLSSFTFNGFHGLNVRVDEAPHRRSI